MLGSRKVLIVKQLFSQQLVQSGRPLSKAVTILTHNYPVRELYDYPPICIRAN